MSLKEEDRRIIVELELERTEKTLRENGEYNCTIEISQKEAIEKIEPTRHLIEKIKK